MDQLMARAEPGTDYLVLMGTAGVLAAVAFLTNSVPMLVGSMIVAPIFSPLALIGFAHVGNRSEQVQMALRAVGLGLGVAVLAAMATTFILNVTNVFPPDENLFDKPLLKERLSVGWFSAVSAAAAGIAGNIALSRDRFDSLIGVLAALALVPAGAAAGIALMSGNLGMAFGGLMLLAVNTGVAVVSGVATLRWLEGTADKT
jgi:uncharacterized membrane protein